MINKIYIYGDDAHALSVFASFAQAITDNSVTWNGIVVYGYASIESAKAESCQFYIKSSGGMQGVINSALANYPDIVTVMPAGSNTPNDHIYDSGGNLPSLLVTGGGDSENETAYDVEFYSNDPTTEEATPDEQDLSSFSNGYVTGSITVICNTLDVSIWTARYLLRQALGGVWSAKNGYGKITPELITTAIGLYISTLNYDALDPYLFAILTEENLILEGQVTTLTEEKLILEGQVTTLTEEKLILEGQVTTLTEEKLILEGQVTTLTEDNLILEGQISTLEGQITTLTEENVLLKGEDLPLGSIGAISVTNNLGNITGAISAVTNAAAYNIYKDDVLLMQIEGLSFVDVIPTSDEVVRYAYSAVRGEQESAKSAAAAVYYPVRKIIGFLKDTDTNYGFAKAAGIYKFELLPALPLLARMNLYNAVDDLLNAKTKLAQEAVTVPVDDDFMNSVYRLIKEQISTYADCDFIYEGETYSESSAQMKPKEVDAPYALTISDEIIIVNTAGAITLLDPAKVNEQIFEIVSQVDGLIPIAAENGALINGLLSITLTRFGEGIRLQAITDKYILLP